MKMFGHRKGEEQVDAGIELEDVVIQVDEAFLVALRDFAQYALDDMRRLGPDYHHVHFQDMRSKSMCKVWKDTWPDIILIRKDDDASGEIA
jgi:hypothetical protein